MQKLFDWLMGLSKGGQIAVLSGVVILFVGGAAYYFLGDRLSQEESEGSDYDVSSDFPDAEVDEITDDKLSLLRKGNNEDVTSFWESLEAESTGNSGGLLGSGVQQSDSKYMHEGVYLDPAVYTSTEIERIKLGIETKEAIDARKFARTQREQVSKTPKPLTQAQQDSVYFARMEMAYGLAAKYSAPAEQPAVPQDEYFEEEAEVEEEEAPKTIEIEVKSLPSVSLSGDNIIRSLGGPSLDQVSDVTVPVVSPSPAKATFLRTENLVNGQRVTMRLMEDLKLSDGTVIPANTHIKGTCNMSSRLNIEVKAISYGGKIYYVNLNIYDNDGTEGIYCPIIAEKRRGKAAKNIASTALSGAASTAATLFTRNAILGRVVSQGINEINGSIDGNGNVTVKVASGYEFYVFEEIEDK